MKRTLTRKVYRCTACGSDDVYVSALVSLNEPTRIRQSDGCYYCHQCKDTPKSVSLDDKPYQYPAYGE